jgi:hypothetical protein
LKLEKYCRSNFFFKIQQPLYFFSSDSILQNRFIFENWLRNDYVKAKRKKQWLLTPSWFNSPFWSFEKKVTSKIIAFFPNPKFQLCCIKIYWAMENSCLAAILILCAIVRHFAPFFFTSYERSLYEVLIYDLVILNFFYGFLSKKNRFLRKKKSVALPSAVISWLSIWNFFPPDFSKMLSS